MLRRLLPLLSATLLVSLVAGCEKRATLEDYNTRVLTLPDGHKIRAEIMIHPEDVMRGMMFRDSLPEDRGMLFLHGEPGNYTYWMYQVKIPLDIIWMDQSGRIVEMSPNTPPCETKASECPNYGGTKEASIVLELAAGMIEKHNLRVGMRIRQ